MVRQASTTKSAKTTPHGPRRKRWSKRARCPRPSAKSCIACPADCRGGSSGQARPGPLGARPRRRHQGACIHGAACMRGRAACQRACADRQRQARLPASTRWTRAVRSPGTGRPPTRIVMRGRRRRRRRSVHPRGSSSGLSRAHQSGRLAVSGRLTPCPARLQLIISRGCHCDARRIGS